MWSRHGNQRSGAPDRKIITCLRLAWGYIVSSSPRLARVTMGDPVSKKKNDEGLRSDTSLSEDQRVQFPSTHIRLAYKNPYF